jgi:hypothetical protein
VICGGSEADHQVAMFGLPLRCARNTLQRAIPAIVARGRADVPYMSNSPSGGAWPLSTNEGVTHYYSVTPLNVRPTTHGTASWRVIDATGRPKSALTGLAQTFRSIQP